MVSEDIDHIEYGGPLLEGFEFLAEGGSFKAKFFAASDVVAYGFYRVAAIADRIL